MSKIMNVECQNEDCIFHGKDNTCSKEGIILGKQGVCKI